VKGHASRRKKASEFTWAETLNDNADKLATAARAVQSKPAALHWPEQHISIDGPRDRISGRLNHEIRYCCTEPDLLSYWQQRFLWTKAQVKSIDLVETRATSRKTRPEMAHRIQKLRCGWLPVNSREARLDPDRVSGCSACLVANLVPKTVDHIFQCTKQKRRATILERFSSFSAEFRRVKTSKSIIAALHAGATAWVEQQEPPRVNSLNIPQNKLGDLIRLAYAKQTSLGWNNLFRGFWSNSWQLAQEEQFCMYRVGNYKTPAGKYGQQMHKCGPSTHLRQYGLS
jgi:hypothetical protein